MQVDASGTGHVDVPYTSVQTQEGAQLSLQLAVGTSDGTTSSFSRRQVVEHDCFAADLVAPVAVGMSAAGDILKMTVHHSAPRTCRLDQIRVLVSRAGNQVADETVQLPTSDGNTRSTWSYEAGTGAFTMPLSAVPHNDEAM